MLEGLTKYWGFYVVAIPDVTGVGVRDLRDALEKVAEYPSWASDLKLFKSEERADREEVNSRIASKRFRKVLASRIVVFQLFLQLAIQVHGTLRENSNQMHLFFKHERIWLLLF